MYHKLMPKQDKGGGIAIRESVRSLTSKYSGGAAKFAAPLLIFLRSSRAHNKRETRIVDTPVIIFKLICFVFLSKHGY